MYFYDDKQPVHHAVILHVQEADLLCYSTSKEGLLYVMKEAELVTWEKWQTIGSKLLEINGLVWESI